MDDDNSILTSTTTKTTKDKLQQAQDELAAIKAQMEKLQMLRQANPKTSTKEASAGIVPNDAGRDR